MTRRDCFLTAAVAASAGGTTRAALKGRLKQAATRGPFGKGKTIEQVCADAVRLGLVGLDLIPYEEWPVLKKHGLIPTMGKAAGHNITQGMNVKESHDSIEKAMRDAIETAARFGAPNLVVLAGSRNGISSERGMENCTLLLNRLKAHAEDKGVTLCMELLNSKVNHPNYQCDHTAWGVEVVKRVNSPRVKLLFDIYHMQIMEGDIIRTIQENIAYIAHFHTAGNPGRHQPDETQELNYRPVAQAIVDAGFQGYLAHEYSPTGDPLANLEKVIRICDV